MEWNIRRGARECSVCAKGFAPDDEYVSCIVEEQEDVFARRDMCPAHWAKREAEFVADPRLISYWRSKVPAKKDETRELRLNLPALWNFFMHLEKPKTRLEENFKYIIALMLMRKKLLELRREIRKNSVEVWVFASVKNPDAEYPVLKPDLSEADILRLTGELKELSANE